MYILGIETSCDDTAIAVAEVKNSKFKILSSIVSSQVKLHAKYGGVYPMLAKREHIKNLPLVFRRATRGIKLSEINLIAVTTGPGLEPCLWQGINFAKDLAGKIKKPIIPVNHIEAHMLANFINLSEAKVRDEGKLRKEANFIDRENFQFSIFNFQTIFPAVVLVVSGGHTQLILVRGIGKYKLIGETRDDAAGECFDKTARILGLSYPGGPIVAKMATKFKIQDLRSKIKLPRPMMYTKNYDFSFSGLKTAVLYNYKSHSSKTRKSKNYIQAMCQEIQQAIIDVLIHKTIKAAKDFKVKSIILGGGVAANDELRKQFKAQSLKSKVNFLVPSKIFCTDNAAMIAAIAYFNRKKAVKNWQKIKADGNLRLRETLSLF